MTVFMGLILMAASIGLFAWFWPRANRPRVWEYSPLLRDMVPLAAVSGLALGITMLVSVFH